MKLDAFTSRHLRQWAERFAPTEEDPDTLCPRMLAFLESLDGPDAEALIARGWTAVFDAMVASEQNPHPKLLPTYTPTKVNWSGRLLTTFGQ